MSKQDTITIGEDWTPTAHNINALPARLRAFVHELVANCDPAETVRDNAILREQNAGLQVMYRKTRDELDAAYAVTSGDWAIDQSAGRPILTYKNCSVIEAEQALQVMNLVRADAARQPTPEEIAEFAKTSGVLPSNTDILQLIADAVTHFGAMPMGVQPRLEVNFNAWPESNGKTNWTVILRRTGKWDGLVGNSGGIMLARGELWNRIAYEAECARYLIGERATEPSILDYSEDIKSPDDWKGEIDGEVLSYRRRKISTLYKARKGLAEARKSQKTWCEYIAGIIATYVGFKLGQEGTDDRIKAITDIIYRRMSFLGPVCSVPDNALDTLRLDHLQETMSTLSLVADAEQFYPMKFCTGGWSDTCRTDVRRSIDIAMNHHTGPITGIAKARTPGQGEAKG